MSREVEPPTYEPLRPPEPVPAPPLPEELDGWSAGEFDVDPGGYDPAGYRAAPAGSYEPLHPPEPVPAPPLPDDDPSEHQVAPGHYAAPSSSDPHAAPSSSSDRYAASSSSSDRYGASSSEHHGGPSAEHHGGPSAEHHGGPSAEHHGGPSAGQDAAPAAGQESAAGKHEPEPPGGFDAHPSAGHAAHPADGSEAHPAGGYEAHPADGFEPLHPPEPVPAPPLPEDVEGGYWKVGDTGQHDWSEREWYGSVEHPESDEAEWESDGEWAAAREEWGPPSDPGAAGLTGVAPGEWHPDGVTGPHDEGPYAGLGYAAGPAPGPPEQLTGDGRAAVSAGTGSFHPVGPVDGPPVAHPAAHAPTDLAATDPGTRPAAHPATGPNGAGSAGPGAHGAGPDGPGAHGGSRGPSAYGRAPGRTDAWGAGVDGPSAYGGAANGTDVAGAPAADAGGAGANGTAVTGPNGSGGQGAGPLGFGPGRHAARGVPPTPPAVVTPRPRLDYLPRHAVGRAGPDDESVSPTELTEILDRVRDDPTSVPRSGRRGRAAPAEPQPPAPAPAVVEEDEPEADPLPPGKRVRVVLSQRKGHARAVRTMVDVQELTQVGEVLASSLIRSQLALALRIAGIALLGLGALPAMFFFVPRLAAIQLFGLRLPWLLLGVLVYPFLLVLGWLYARSAEKIEQIFADHIQS